MPKPNIEAFQQREPHPSSREKRIEDRELLAGDFTAEERYARDLQRRLAASYDESVSDTKLPVRQRVAVIVGLTLALWLLIAGIIGLIIRVLA
ncbi:hypothetical protein [Novosphingobium sp. M1R2S20]|uniref:DUF3094 family protein n=1 Tax=Novosphingobium rhizovicinum TaxID=3228928 RepID=A0ABV3RDM2_9SPHN